MEDKWCKDIPLSNLWKSVEPINIGFSKDRKYQVVTNCNKYFLRITDKGLQYINKIVETTEKLIKLSVLTPSIVDYGLCDGGKKAYLIQEWISGEVLETLLPNLTKSEQYKLGVESGKQLLKIHSIISPNPCDWKARRLFMYESNYEKYKAAGLSYSYEEKINNYIYANLNVLENQKTTLIHGDYHVGNIMKKQSGDLCIIDFNRMDYQCPIEDFYKLGVFSRNISTSFCRGQINGYTDNNPTEEFWRQYDLCIAMTCFLSLLWGKNHSEEMYYYRKSLCDNIIDDHKCFDVLIPAWYK